MWRAFFVLLLLSCGDDGASTDGGVDAGADAAIDAGVLVTFDAVADPAERTDCAAEPPADGTARAKHVVCAEELPTGPLAHGRIGDVLLENARVRFVVRAQGGSATLLAGGEGAVIDATTRGGHDLLKELFVAFDLAGATPSAVVVTDAGGDGTAAVRVLFEAGPIGMLGALLPGADRGRPVQGAIDYVLSADDDALRVRVHVIPNGVSDPVPFRPAAVVFVGGSELTQPFFGPLLEDLDGGRTPLPTIVGEDELGALAVRLVVDEGTVAHVKSLHVLQSTSPIRAAPAQAGLFEIALAPGPTAAAAWAAARAGVEGDVVLRARGTAGDRVEVTTPEGTRVLRTRLDEDGAADVPLPPGDYLLRRGFEGFFDDGEARAVAVAADAEEGFGPYPAGELAVAVDVDGDGDAPVRVTARRGGDVVRFAAVGPTTRRLPAGDWEVTVARGMEHTRLDRSVAVVAGERAELTATLERVVDTTGWVSGDFHVHSDLSNDSLTPVLEGLRAQASEGVEVVASTDHDYVADYPALVEMAGVADWLLVAPGVETSPLWTHINAYPLRFDAGANAGGAPSWIEAGPNAIVDAMRAQSDPTLGAVVVQLNHPRKSPQGYFTTARLDETGHLTASPGDLGLPAGEDLDRMDFDAIEVWNGGIGGEDEESFEDYLLLESVGRTFTMVGNSDTHELTSLAGSPRTYVRVEDDSPGGYDWSEIGESIRAGRAVVAGGVFVTAELDGPERGGSVPVHVRVQAAPWVAVDQLRVYAGREVVVDRPIEAPPEAVVRLDEVVDVPLGGARFVIVRVDGGSAAPPVLTDEPFGITNPLRLP